MRLLPRKVVKPPLSHEENMRIVEAIRQAESLTTGEIRLFIESKCNYVDPIDRAAEIFDALEMEKTEKHNAVVIYLAIDDRQFALYGDNRVYEKLGGQIFWKEAASHLKSHLRIGELVEGLLSCITEIGLALEKSFPYDPSVTKNELPDEIVFGKDL